MRGDGGTPRGLRAQQTNSREAGGTTSNPSRQTQPANAQLKRRRSQHQAPMPLRPADQHRTIRRAKTKPARNQTNGRRAKQIRRAIKTKPANNQPQDKKANKTGVQRVSGKVAIIEFKGWMKKHREHLHGE